MKELSVVFTNEMIAPCGINCGTCLAFLRDKNRCPGCLFPDEEKRKSCQQCKIKNCPEHSVSDSILCCDCSRFPCQRIKHIDKRYRTKYKTSLINNLLSVKEIGIGNFLKNEQAKWKCPYCCSTVSVHSEKCLICGGNLNKPAVNQGF
jgi:hypothetical protein